MVPIIRIIVFWGLHWGPPILGNYHLGSGLNLGHGGTPVSKVGARLGFVGLRLRIVESRV